MTTEKQKQGSRTPRSGPEWASQRAAAPSGHAWSRAGLGDPETFIWEHVQKRRSCSRSAGVREKEGGRRGRQAPVHVTQECEQGGLRNAGPAFTGDMSQSSRKPGLGWRE